MHCQGVTVALLALILVLKFATLWPIRTAVLVPSECALTWWLNLPCVIGGRIGFSRYLLAHGSNNLTSRYSAGYLGVKFSFLLAV